MMSAYAPWGARAAKLGLEAANHAAEIKLRAERKAGELLAQLERDTSFHGNQTVKSQPGKSPSEYTSVLTDNDIPTTTAHRWQTGWFRVNFGMVSLSVEFAALRTPVTPPPNSRLGTVDCVCRSGAHMGA